jgi:mono/diheme cytochrome c family protein
MNFLRFTAKAVLVAGLVLFSHLTAYADDFKFTDEFLHNEANILRGREQFLLRCTYCHAKRGVGKAPQLRPSERPPEFIFDRVTNGYAGMPPWGTVLPEETRRAIVAYIRSNPDKY